MTKKWYQSWTVWVNLAGGIAVAALGVLTEAGLKDAGWIAPALAFANILLRFKTDSAIKG